MKWNGGIKNEFLAETASDPVIRENFDGEEKKDVLVGVGNTGCSVYVRAAVVVTWMNADGEVFSQSPVAGTDYAIEWNLSDSGWSRGDDGFYYYAAPVESGGETAVLIRNCAPLTEAPKEGYALNVKIAAQTIQAAGTTDGGEIPAVTDAWGG